MDPYDVLVPNRLAAGPEPRTVPIARCTCGEYGCGGTDVTIVRDGDTVHWDWSIEAPTGGRASFPSAAYDAEVARAAADHSWETPERTAGRLVLAGADRDHLLRYGFTLTWVANDHRDPGRFRAALMLDGDYQVFVDTPWSGRDPEQLAGAVCATLAAPPGRWKAAWHPIHPGVSDPPALARRSWSRYHR